jgi:hypothetical protein
MTIGSNTGNACATAQIATVSATTVPQRPTACASASPAGQREPSAERAAAAMTASTSHHWSA